MEENMAVEWCGENGVSTFDDGTHSHCIAKTEDNGGIESKRFYLARTTALEMLRDRGYQVSDAELSPSLSEFRSAFGEKPDLERLRICVPLHSDPKKKIGDLLVNITKHTGQPKIEILTKEEKEKLLSEHGLEDKQEKDSFVRYYGLKKRQVVKITYSKEPVGSFVTYRCIV